MTDAWLRIVVGIIAAIAVFAALQAGKAVFAPIACALFIIAIVWPMQRRLQSRMPKLLALAIVILVVASVLAFFVLLIGWSLGRIARSLAADAAYIQSLYDSARAWFELHGIATAGLWAEQFNVRWILRAVQEVTGRLNTIVVFWLVVVVYVILGLLEVDVMARKADALVNRSIARLLIDGSEASSTKLRRYMLIRTLMSVATGALVWALASATGLKFAVEWGVLAFALNYIPFIGPFAATMFPALFALAQFASWQSALLLFAGLNIIQFVVGSYIEPRVAGRTLSISPFFVLFSVFFWTFLWGLFGAFIGVPIMIAVLTFCAQHSSSRWLADLIGGPSADVPSEKPL
jgi:predicted PurR-regulated permease PerM